MESALKRMYFLGIKYYVPQETYSTTVFHVKTNSPRGSLVGTNRNYLYIYTAVNPIDSFTHTVTQFFLDIFIREWFHATVPNLPRNYQFVFA